jgi:hypothetical protein
MANQAVYHRLRVHMSTIKGLQVTNFVQLANTTMLQEQTPAKPVMLAFITQIMEQRSVYHALQENIAI